MWNFRFSRRRVWNLVFCDVLHGSTSQKTLNLIVMRHISWLHWQKETCRCVPPCTLVLNAAKDESDLSRTKLSVNCPWTVTLRSEVVSTNSYTYYSIRPKIPQQNVVVAWLSLLLRIQEVPGWNLIPKTAILTEAFRVFSQFLQASAGIVP
jgi:hypothetical protein